jgi:hypothetical protein
MNYPAISPAHIGPAMLAVFKQGKAVERITVWFSHAQLHHLFSEQISKNFPLEIVLAKGRDMEKRIDCRFHQAPWHIDIRTDEQKQEANRAKAAIAPALTPPAPESEKSPELVRALVELFEPYHARAESEYRQLTAVLQKARLKGSLDRHHREQVGDTAHVQ